MVGVNVGVVVGCGSWSWGFDCGEEGGESGEKDEKRGRWMVEKRSVKGTMRRVSWRSGSHHAVGVGLDSTREERSRLTDWISPLEGAMVVQRAEATEFTRQTITRQ